MAVIEPSSTRAGWNLGLGRRAWLEQIHPAIPPSSPWSYEVCSSGLEELAGPLVAASTRQHQATWGTNWRTVTLATARWRRTTFTLAFHGT